MQCLLSPVSLCLLKKSIAAFQTKQNFWLQMTHCLVPLQLIHCYPDTNCIIVRNFFVKYRDFLVYWDNDNWCKTWEKGRRQCNLLLPKWCIAKNPILNINKDFKPGFGWTYKLKFWSKYWTNLWHIFFRLFFTPTYVYDA